MRRCSTFTAIVLVGMACATSVHAVQYTRIENNAFEGVSDASYLAHVFTWRSSDTDPITPASNILTLVEDAGFVPGFTGNVVLEITTNFASYGTLPDPTRALFTGGSLSLKFDYSPDGVGVTSHELSGPISQASIAVKTATPTQSTLDGIINFDSNLGIENLPSSNNWPAIGKSTAVALTFAIGADLSDYITNFDNAWDKDMPTPPSVTYDTVFKLYPEEQVIPEPACLGLMGLGVMLMLRRRAA